MLFLLAKIAKSEKERGPKEKKNKQCGCVFEKKTEFGRVQDGDEKLSLTTLAPQMSMIPG